MTKELPILDIISEAAAQASQIVKAHFDQGLAPDIKSSPQDLVTRGDLESQARIQKIITQKLTALGVDESEIGFIGEERGLYRKGKYLFAVDPIDGTTNFASGIEYFAVEIGGFVDGELTYAVLQEPMTNTVYFAKKGEGAFKRKNGKEKKLSMVRRDLKDSLVTTYLHSDAKLREMEMRFMADIYPSIRGFRVMGAGALDLMKIADNVLHIGMFATSNIWDVAAAALIIQEAGGAIVDLNGDPLFFDLDNPAKSYPVVVCHPDNLKKVLGFLK